MSSAINSVFSRIAHPLTTKLRLCYAQPVPNVMPKKTRKQKERTRNRLLSARADTPAVQVDGYTIPSTYTLPATGEPVRPAQSPTTGLITDHEFRLIRRDIMKAIILSGIAITVEYVLSRYV